MATADRRRRGRSPPSTASSSRSPGACASSPYFLPDLIPEVAKRLTNLQDFFALRAACRAYRALLPLTASNLASQAPLLLVPGDTTQLQSHTLFHLHLRRIHRFRLPSSTVVDADADADQIQIVLHPLGCRLAIYTRYCCRLFVSHLGNCRVSKRDLSIIHLLTGERIRLPCPRFHVSRVLLFGDLVVAWTCESDGIGIPGQIGYCRIGALEPSWHLVSISLPNKLEDMIFVKGTLYALVNPGHRLAVVELPVQKKDFKLVFLGRPFATPELKSWLLCLADCRGELLLVSRRDKGQGFLVLQWQSGEEKWEEITSLEKQYRIVGHRFGSFQVCADVLMSLELQSSYGEVHS
ncbi:hypothetical protein BS78_07G220400 [Paspalum vaginatum]|nr:hypothetical protein BS78_07G220400 [Paspalum vaginatum]